MTVTMMNMELIFADLLSPEQLMVGDIIKTPNQEMVVINEINDADGGYLIVATDDYEDEIEFFVADDTMLKWYVYSEQEEE